MNQFQILQDKSVSFCLKITSDLDFSHFYHYDYLMRYSIELGDSSSDGHGISEVFYVKVPAAFTPAILAENYASNVAKFGFGYHDIADDPNSPTISRSQVNALEAAGMRFIFSDYSDVESSKLLTDKRSHQNVVMLDTESHFDKEEEFYFHENDMDFTGFLRIIMFMIGNGLPDFKWKRDDIEATVLVGMSSSAVSNQNAGYGLFGN